MPESVRSARRAGLVLIALACALAGLITLGAWLGGSEGVPVATIDGPPGIAVLAAVLLPGLTVGAWALDRTVSGRRRSGAGR